MSPRAALPVRLTSSLFRKQQPALASFRSGFSLQEQQRFHLGRMYSLTLRVVSLCELSLTGLEDLSIDTLGHLTFRIGVDPASASKRVRRLQLRKPLPGWH